MLCFEVAVLAGVVWLVATGGVPGHADWLRFGTLAAAIVVHLSVVKRAEEDRRDSAAGPHFTLTSVWMFAAVVVLPAALAVLVAVLIRALTYPIARRQPYRYLFSSAEMLGSMLAASTLVRVTGVQAHAGVTGLRDLLVIAVFVLAGAVYYGAQALAVGGAMKLTLPATAWRDVLGTRSENLMEMITLAGGAILGLLMSGHWAAPLLVVLPLSYANRMLDDARQRQQHLERLVREQYQAHQRLSKDAHTDFRTGLLNSNGLAEQAGRLVTRCRELGNEVTVLAIDLDHFKRINDSWGHPAGNAVLAEIGRILREKLRPGDLAGRDGGEEFVVVLADTTLAAGVAAAERIRHAIGALAVPTTDKHSNAITLLGRGEATPAECRDELRAISASIGVASIPTCGATMATAQHVADTALYEAKENGRNQVRAAEVGEVEKPVPAPRSGDQVESALF
ncbi:GGDEF domain-containing protein [Solihabitans fulvus]|uniref:GGDEF domain-containing protein n=1 Tax=Solihabitans fulvus TaxID=1892852 RepID=UPI001CB7653C|nr:GGDEF domain-containing protein [Solihabitans fulvus]